MDGNNMNEKGYVDNQAYTDNTYNQYATYQPAAAQPGKGLGIASMVLGILALLITLISCCFAPLLILSGIMGLVSIILGIMAIAKKRGKGMGIAGLICSIVGLFLAIGIIAMSALGVGIFGAAMNEAMEDYEDYYYDYDYYDDYDYYYDDYDYDF